MIKVNAMGDACPLPVVKAKNAIKELGGSGIVEVKVDNEIAVQNLAKMAKQKGYGMKSHKISAGEFDVTLEIGEGAAATGVADIPEAVGYADEFLLTAAGQRNRNNTIQHVKFDEDISFAMQEILFDPQTSGGLLIALPAEQADALVEEIKALGLPGAIVGEINEPAEKEIYVTKLNK